MTYKEYLIPKKGGKFRKIVAPDAELKQALRAELPDLNKYFEKYSKMFGVRNQIHGFVHKRNVKSAAKEHIGYPHTIMMDISAFFDTVTREDIPYSLRKDIMFHKEGYTPQGFPTSPVLANIAVVPIMSKIKRNLNQVIGKGQYAITIYADDIQVSIKTKEVIASVIDVVTKEFTDGGFSINKRKTRVRHAQYGYRRILGINVGDKVLQPTRKTLRKLRAAKHQKNSNSAGGLASWASHITK